METRQITQVKIYFLILNMMRDRMEGRSMVATAYSKEALCNWYQSLLVPEGYSDTESDSDYVKTYHKSFQKGSALEWYNTTNLDVINDWGHGVFEEWVNQEDFSEGLKSIHIN